jgi:hypothetical protein
MSNNSTLSGEDLKDLERRPRDRRRCSMNPVPRTCDSLVSTLLTPFVLYHASTSPSEPASQSPPFQMSVSHPRSADRTRHGLSLGRQHIVLIRGVTVSPITWRTEEASAVVSLVICEITQTGAPVVQTRNQKREQGTHQADRNRKQYMFQKTLLRCHQGDHRGQRYSSRRSSCSTQHVSAY